MVEIGYLAACQTFYHKLVANVSIYNRGRRNKDYLELEHFVGAFLLLGVGLLLSACLFIGEILSTPYHEWRHRHALKASDNDHKHQKGKHRKNRERKNRK